MSFPGQAPRAAGNHGTVPETPAPARTGAALDELIRQLNVDYQLGLPNDKMWSPKDYSSTLAGKVCLQIQQLYYPGVLGKILDDFKDKADNLQQIERLNLLHLLLRSQRPSRSVRTPGSRTTRDEPHKSPLSPTPVQSIQSHYTTARESGSPTDEDTDNENEFTTPPSPTLSTRSGRLGSQLQAGHHLSFGPLPRKRNSDGSHDEQSPKHTRTAKGKQPLGSPSLTVAEQTVIPPPIFKKPSLNMARSYKADSTQTSLTTSFNSNYLSSSQQTGETMATSFNSDFAGIKPESTRMTRTSSTTMGSLDDQFFLEVDSRLEKEQLRTSDASTTRTSSNYGSVNTDNFQDADLQAGTMHITAPVYNQGIDRALDASVPLVRTPPKQLSSTSAPIGDSRSRSAQDSPKPVQLKESPSKTTYHVRNIPFQNIFVEELTDNLLHFPYFILFICLRIAMDNNLSLQELMEGMDATAVESDPEIFWAFIHGHPKVQQHSGQGSPKLWSSMENQFEGFVFKGLVTFNTKSYGPVFQLTILPPQPDNSSRLERAFRADRFLYLNFPSYDTGITLPRFNKGEIRDRWREWLQEEHSFLGRKWHAFHVEPLKKPKGRRRNGNESYGYRVVLFAIEGIGIDNACSIGEMLNWFFPFAENKGQSICKAFAREDLGLSRTVPTLAFKPSQVYRVPDRHADNTPEDVRFNDPSLLWPEFEDRPVEDRPVMDDGCSLISYGAALEIWRQYEEKAGIHEQMPSAFQARIGGAKGMWVVSDDSNSHNTGQPDLWINISKSQLKFEPHPEDKSNEYDPRRLTFEIVRYTSDPSPSDLHLSFISILVDRGVPVKAIERTMMRRLNVERAEVLKILVDPAQVYNWVHKQGLGTQDGQKIPWQAGFPLVLGDRIKAMLESGFSPTAEPYLGQCLSRFIKQQQLFEEQKLRIPLGKSTILFGIADPLGILAPGEVHIHFSSRFVDDMDKTSYTCLADLDILVARQPACRRSDLQKVRAVSRPRLGHLVDVVVFPSRGRFPLAGKLQGGDYDGDKFWICWERELVQPFKNAPAPTMSPNPSDYHIGKYEKKLEAVIVPHELRSVKGFLKDAMDFRVAPDLLGKVTNYLERQSYAENRIYSPTLESLCDMHDLLVDAPKQGYTFTDQDFDMFKKKKSLPRNPKDPAYKRAMDACMNAKEMGEGDLIREMDWSPNYNNPIDYLYFQVVRKHHVETQLQVAKMLAKVKGDDALLQRPYLDECQKRNPAIEKELDKLLLRLESVVREWNTGMAKSGNADQFNATVDRCYKIFREHVPDKVQPPEIKVWFETPYLSRGFTQWELIRASTLYTKYPHKAALIFHMAGEQLAYLKRPEGRESRTICNSVYSLLRPRTIKIPSRLEESDNDDDDFGTPAEYFSLQTP